MYAQLGDKIRPLRRGKVSLDYNSLGTRFSVLYRILYAKMGRVMYRDDTSIVTRESIISIV